MKLDENEMLFFEEYKRLCKKYETCIRWGNDGEVYISSLHCQEIELDEYGEIIYKLPFEEHKNVRSPILNHESLSGVLKMQIKDQNDTINWSDFPKMAVFNEGEK